MHRRQINPGTRPTADPRGRRNILQWMVAGVVMAPTIPVVEPIVGPPSRGRPSDVSVGSFQREPCRRLEVFKVTSWNIAYGRRYRHVTTALTAALRSDIFFLQEVDRMTNRTRDSDTRAYRDVPVLLARELAANYVYGIEFQELSQDAPDRPACTGQEILASPALAGPELVRYRYQPADWSRGWLGLFQKRNGGRMFLYCLARINDVDVHLYNTHLESRASERDRLDQVRELVEHVQTNVLREAPVIIAGDLNTRQSTASPVVGCLRSAGFSDGLEQFSAREQPTNSKGDRRLDWIFSRNLTAVHAVVAADFMGSDHKAVSVTYRAPGRAPELE